MLGDRRTHKRIHPDSNVMVMIKPYSWEIGNIVFADKVLDISEGGTAFSYVGYNEWPDNILSLEIIDDKLHIEGLPIRIVSDIPLGAKAVSNRRCSVKFGGLTERQRKILKSLLDHQELEDLK